MPAAIQRRIGTIFPQLGKVAIADVFGGAVGLTVHGMPQIGQLRKGLWVASGFGRQGMNTTAMAGQLIARSILWGDERWRLFSPFELVWAGGADRPGRRACDRHVGPRGSSAAAGALARYREGARAKDAHTRGAAGRSQPPGRHPPAAAPPRAGPPRPRRARCRRREPPAPAQDTGGRGLARK